MTINEFKAWLEGFNENVGTHPTADQWRKIKAKINQLSTSKEKAFDVSEWTKKYNRDYYLGEKHDDLKVTWDIDPLFNMSSMKGNM